ncbi:MAG: nucleotide exchange factor GrpE [Saprospiraceae bacterium]
MLTEENKLNNEEVENLIDQPTNDEQTIEENSEETNEPQESNSESQVNELSDQKDKFLRLYAEFDNFKRRTSKERIDLIKTAGQDIIVELISILDDFERAQKIARETGNLSVYPEGMSLIHHKLLSLLTNKGLKTMQTENVAFNPENHEAIAEIPTSEENLKGKIIDTIEKGYMLSDKIIRFAKVVVGK